MRVWVLAAVLLAGCVPAKGESVVGDWGLLRMDGAAVGFTATLNLEKPGHISGQAPCNGYFGTAKITEGRIEIGALAATKMACTQLDGELAYMAALQGATQIDVQEGFLTLRGGGHELEFAKPIE